MVDKAQYSAYGWRGRARTDNLRFNRPLQTTNCATRQYLVRAVGLLPTHILRVPQILNYTMLAFGATARLCSEDSTLARLRVTITPQSQRHTIRGIGMSAMFVHDRASAAPLISITPVCYLEASEPQVAPRSDALVAVFEDADDMPLVFYVLMIVAHFGHIVGTKPIFC